MRQSLKHQIVTKLKNSNCAKIKKKLNCDNSKTQIGMVIKMTVVMEVVIMTSSNKKYLNTLTTDQLSGQLFAILAMFSSELEGFSYWWSCIGKGRRLQPLQQACFYKF